MKCSKTVVLGLTLLSLTAAMSCSKAHSKNSKDSDETELIVLKEEKTDSSQNLSAKDKASIEKFEKVYAQMSDRFKGDIKFKSDNQVLEFIQELESILEEEKSFNKDDLSLFYLIDKKHTVASDYEPKGLIHLEKNPDYAINKNNLNLRPEAFKALAELGKQAKADGVQLTVSSTYRSYAYQKELFNYWVSVDGLEEAERESARPGTSQHQLGLALDFAPVDDKFDETPGGQWVYENASRFGWSLSFPMGYEDVTGYRWECWHFRYVGINACNFQKKWFNNIQQFMLEFIDCWKNT